MALDPEVGFRGGGAHQGPAGGRVPEEVGTWGWGTLPCRDLAVVHVGRDDDTELALAPLRTKRDRGLAGALC